MLLDRKITRGYGVWVPRWEGARMGARQPYLPHLGPSACGRLGDQLQRSGRGAGERAAMGIRRRRKGLGDGRESNSTICGGFIRVYSCFMVVLLWFLGWFYAGVIGVYGGFMVVLRWPFLVILRMVDGFCPPKGPPQNGLRKHRATFRGSLLHKLQCLGGLRLSDFVFNSLMGCDHTPWQVGQVGAEVAMLTGSFFHGGFQLVMGVPPVKIHWYEIFHI